MIDIIVKGNRPEDRVYRNSCGHCGSLLQFKASDGRLVHDQRDGDALVIECPECKSDVWTAVDAYQKISSAKDIEALSRRMHGML